jgi:hypothetical protein
MLFFIWEEKFMLGLSDITEELRFAVVIGDLKMIGDLLASELEVDISPALYEAVYKIKMMNDRAEALPHPSYSDDVKTEDERAALMKIVRLLLDSGRKDDITKALKLATQTKNWELLNLLVASKCEGSITETLNLIAISYTEHAIRREIFTQILNSERKGDITLALSHAVHRWNLDMVTLLLDSRREYNIKGMLGDGPTNHLSREIVELIRTSTPPQLVVRTGEEIEGSKTHQWQIGGLRFLASRAIAQATGGELRLQPKPKSEDAESSLQFKPG